MNPEVKLMPSASAHDVKVADEVWIATALLHRKRPAMVDFTIEEIVESARKEAITANQRPGIYVHVLQHCVANRPPNPGRYCMLLETEKGRRRLCQYCRNRSFSRQEQAGLCGRALGDGQCPALSVLG